MFFRIRKPSVATFEEQLEALRRQGFTVERSAAGFRVAKGGCAAVLEPVGPTGARFVEAPGILVDGEIARLVDKGYQKFLHTRARGEQAALAEHLKAIHRFNQELRSALPIPALYNLSLGTVSNVYHYDRVRGRE